MCKKFVKVCFLLCKNEGAIIQVNKYDNIIGRILSVQSDQ
jgi:hypothetical protein